MDSVINIFIVITLVLFLLTVFNLYAIHKHMPSVSFYGGVNEIGGNKILLEDNDTRIFLDFGGPKSA